MPCRHVIIKTHNKYIGRYAYAFVIGNVAFTDLVPGASEISHLFLINNTAHKPIPIKITPNNNML